MSVSLVKASKKCAVITKSDKKKSEQIEISQALVVNSSIPPDGQTRLQMNAANAVAFFETKKLNYLYSCVGFCPSLALSATDIDSLFPSLAGERTK